MRRNAEDEVSTLLQLPKAFNNSSGCDLTSVNEYLTKEFPRESSAATKQKVLECWIEDFSAKEVNDDDTIVIRFLLKPMVEWLVSHDQQDAITDAIVDSLVHKVFGQISLEDSACSELFQSEVVQVCVELVKHVPEALREYKKQIIQYVWYVELGCALSPRRIRALIRAIFYLQVDIKERQHRQTLCLPLRCSFLPGISKRWHAG